MGYIIASVISNVSHNAELCLSLLCWRWPFLVEIMLLVPLYFGLYFVPKEDIAVPLHSRGLRKRKLRSSHSEIEHHGGNEEYGIEDTVTSYTYGNQLQQGGGGGGDRSTALTTVSANGKSSFDRGDANRALLEQRAFPLWAATSGAGAKPDDSLDNLLAPQADLESNDGTNSSVGAGLDSTTPTSLFARLSHDELERRHSLRRQAMSASMYDCMSSRNVIRRSCDDFAQLGE